MHKLFRLVGFALIFSAALPFGSSAALGDDRRPTTPTAPPQPGPSPQGSPQPQQPSCPPKPPCPPPSPEPKRDYEIRITSIDAARSAIPAVSAVLASTSNREDQRAGLQVQAKRGVSLSRISYGPTLKVSQDGVDTRDNSRDESPKWPGSSALPAVRTRITAHPHLNANCAEAVDLAVEQVPAGMLWTGSGSRRSFVFSSFVFENGDTRLLSETLRPDGTFHLVYATVFFPPR